MDPARHLAGGFVGEGDGENTMGRNAVDGNPVGDGGGQSRGLSGPCPGQDEDRSGVGSRLDLGLG
jgi:hypothetical protein